MRLIPILLLLLAATASAQELPHPSKRLLCLEENAAKFDLVYGRIRFDNLTTRGHQRQAVEYVDGCTASYTLQGEELACEATSPGEYKVTVQNDEDSFHYVRENFYEAQTKQVAEFQQTSDGWCSLTVREPIAIVKAPTIWHMLLLEPELAKKHLVPMLNQLEVHVDAEMADQIVAAVVKHAQEKPLPDFDQKAELLVQLSESNYGQRRKAEAELSKMGPTALPFLRNPPYKLDREQQEAVKSVIKSIEAAAPDTIERLAMWLAEDPWVWAHIHSQTQEVPAQTFAPAVASSQADLPSFRVAASSDDEDADRLLAEAMIKRLTTLDAEPIVIHDILNE